MTIDEWIYQNVLNALPSGMTLMSSGASGAKEAGNSPSRPFAVWHGDGSMGGLGHVKQKVISVWVHDDPGTLARINLAIEDLEGTLPAAAPYRDGEITVMDCSWQFSSADAFDDFFKTNTRYAEFRLTWRN